MIRRTVAQAGEAAARFPVASGHEEGTSYRVATAGGRLGLQSAPRPSPPHGFGAHLRTPAFRLDAVRSPEILIAVTLTGSTHMSDDSRLDADAVFEERAENLTDEQFSEWTFVSDFEERVLRQLTSSAPKLLVGPRGCGKSTLLRLAYDRIQSQGRDLPIFVNYGKSMFLEPAFTVRTDADAFFQDWLVARIAVAAGEALDTANMPEGLRQLEEHCREFIGRAETDPKAQRLKLPGPTLLSALLSQWAEDAGKGRVVLLLDDAAHAFVPEQQRIFFEFLRSLRSPTVTFKAAVYPGVTHFSPNFNVGHDAKAVVAWVGTDTADYLEFMRQLLDKRLPDRGGVAISDDLVDFFAVASFGIPRTFMSMVESYIDQKPKPARVAQAATAIINIHADQTEKLYDQLATKLPTFSRYVAAGDTVRRNMLAQVEKLNRGRSAHDSAREQVVEIAVKQPLDAKLVTILSLLEYAGLVRQTNETVSLGNAGTFTKVAIHSGLLLAHNAVSFRQNPTISERARAAMRQSRQSSFKRVAADVLLDKETAENCRLQVGACPRCGTPRQVEGARFCTNCGQELVDESRYAALVQANIEALALTPKKLTALRQQGFHTVDDILRDRGMSEMQKANRIGGHWSRRIYSLAEEYVSV